MIRRGNELDHTVLGPGVRMLCAGLGVLAVAGSVQAGAQWTLYENDYAGWSAAVSTPRSYTFAGTGLPLGANIADLYADDGIKLGTSTGGSATGYTFPVFLAESTSADSDGFAMRRWDWNFVPALRFRFATPIRAIYFETDGFSNATWAWSAGVAMGVNDSCFCNHGLVFTVPVDVLTISATRVQNFHVEFVPAPGVLPAMFLGAVGMLRRRVRCTSRV
jgi:hypothetical protein